MTARPMTDLGLAERFGDKNRMRARFARSLGWLHWTDTHWRRDDTGEIYRMATATVRAIHNEARDSKDTGLSKELGVFAIKSEARPKIEAMISLAEKDERIFATAESFDRDPWLLNTLSGTIDLKSGVLRPHDPNEYITKIAPVEYDPEATCPRFGRFMLEVMDGKQENVAFLRRVIGYALTGSVKEHALIFLYGQGRNGKGTLVETVLHVLGTYAAPASSGLLLGSKDEADPRSGVAQLRGARLVVATEVGKGKRLNEALVKKLTGADTLRGSFLYTDSFEFKPTHKLWLQGNHKPVITGTDPAIWARIYLVPFSVSFEGREDHDLPEKLKSEGPGILNWMLEGCREWQELGLVPPKAVVTATGAYRHEMDKLAPFLESECAFEPAEFTTTEALKDAYATWAKEADEEGLSWNEISGRLREKGCRADRKAGKRGWYGVRFKTSEEVAEQLALEVGHE